MGVRDEMPAHSLELPGIFWGGIIDILFRSFRTKQLDSLRLIKKNKLKNLNELGLNKKAVF